MTKRGLVAIGFEESKGKLGPVKGLGDEGGYGFFYFDGVHAWLQLGTGCFSCRMGLARRGCKSAQDMIPEGFQALAAHGQATGGTAYG